MHRLRVAALLAGLACRPATVDPTLKVTATATGWSGVGWADIVEVELSGDLTGRASLWIPPGPGGKDPVADVLRAGLVKTGDALPLTLEPMSPADDERYVLHLERTVDGVRARYAIGH